MASSNRFPIVEPAAFYHEFPRLTDKNHLVSSPATPQPTKITKPYRVYNCFAFVIGDKSRFWWPGGYGYWPDPESSETVEELVRVLTSFGYQECASQKFEKGVQKVAIFARDGIPVHVAIQPSNRSGIWKSKMGYNIDMEHELRAIETHADDDPQKQGYGKLAKIMSKTSARKAK